MSVMETGARETAALATAAREKSADEAQSATVPFDLFAFHRVGVSGIVGQALGPRGNTVGMHGWRKSDPRF